MKTAYTIWILMIIGLAYVLYHTATRPMDEDTTAMLVYNNGPDRTDDCTFVGLENDIFWTDVYMACNESTLPEKMNNYTLRYTSDYKKHYMSSKNSWKVVYCHGKNNYHECSKMFAYRKYML